MMIGEPVQSFHHRAPASALPRGTELFFYAAPVRCWDCHGLTRETFVLKDGAEICFGCLGRRFERIALERVGGRKIIFAKAGPPEPTWDVLEEGTEPPEED